MPPADIIVQATTSFLVSFVVFTCVSQILQRRGHHRQALYVAAEVLRDAEGRTPAATTRAPTTGTRDGGPFTALAVCPHCGDYSVHPMRLPNPDSPYRPAGLGHRIELAPGGITYQRRWDERPYEIVRTCNTCGKEWGHR